MLCLALQTTLHLVISPTETSLHCNIYVTSLTRYGQYNLQSYEQDKCIHSNTLSYLLTGYQQVTSIRRVCLRIRIAALRVNLQA